MHARMKASYEYDVEGRPGVRRTLPVGWVGDLPDDVAFAAEAAGCAVLTRPVAAKPKKGGKGGKAAATGADASQADAGEQVGQTEGAGGDAGDAAAASAGA